MSEVQVGVALKNCKSITNKAEFVRQLIDMRNQASEMNLHRGVLCLDYAHWEFIAETRPDKPFTD